MRIAIEAQRIFRRNKHGMDFVALETIRRLARMDTRNEYFIMVSPGDDRCLDGTDNMHVVEIGCPTYPLWEQLALPEAVRKIKPDLLHCTSNTAPIRCGVPLVLTLHDIIFMEKRRQGNKSLYQNLGRLYRRAVVPRILPDCRRIITVSEFERERIREALDIPEEKIVAVHNGYGEHFRPLADTREVTAKYLPDEKYLFFLGNTDPKKNTPGTLKAYADYAGRSASPLPLLVADLSEGTVEDILGREGITRVRPLLRLAGYIPNTDLPYVYSGASAFLYTSFRESFGIPLLEAMACGTPVVSSSVSAIPEVAGPGAVLVNPAEPALIADALLRLETDEAYRKNAISYGLERVKNFSWEKSARMLLEVYESL